jgi:hypothetical protein
VTKGFVSKLAVQVGSDPEKKNREWPFVVRRGGITGAARL